MITGFVKNSCAAGHLLAAREMKVHGIITGSPSTRTIEI